MNARAAERRRPAARAPGDPSGAGTRGVAALVVAALVLACGFVYAQLGGHAFLHFDDSVYITSNPHVRTGLTWANAAWAFGEFRSNTWHPLAWLSHQLDCTLFGLDAGRHHLVSALIHALNAALVFLLLRRLTGATWRSAFVAASFAVHPMHVESVAWAAERKDVLSTLCALLTMWAHADWVRRPSPVRYAAVLACGALAVLAKPMMVTLPMVLLLLDWWPLQRFGFGKVRGRAPVAPLTLVVEKLPLFAFAGVSAALTMMAKRDLVQHAFGMRLATAFVSLARYAGQLLVPVTQAFYYPYPKEPPVLGAIVSALACVALTAWFWRLRRTHAYALVGWLWFVGTLLPVIGLEQVATHAMADRYSYLPSLGLAILVVWGLADLARPRPALTRALAALGALVLVVFAVRARAQAAYWHDGITLFSHDITVVPENTLGWRNLGVEYCDAGRWAEAVPMFENVLRVYPGDAVSEFDLARALEALGRSDEAVAHYRASLRGDAERAATHYNLGTLLNRTGHPNEAVAELREAIRIAPDDAPAYNNLGNALAALGRDAEAIASYQQAIGRDPAYAEAHNNLGTAWRKLGHTDDALAEFTTAQRLKPDFGAAVFNAGVVYLVRGDTVQARARFAEAVRLDPALATHLPPALRTP